MIKEYYLNLKFKIFPKLAVGRTAALVSSIYLSASQHKIYSCTTPLLRHYYNKYFSYFFIENLLILEEQCRILTFLLIMQGFFAPVRFVWMAIHCIICVGQNISIAEYLSQKVTSMPHGRRSHGQGHAQLIYRVSMIAEVVDSDT